MNVGGIALALEEEGQEEALVPLALWLGCWHWQQVEEQEWLPHQALPQVSAVDAEVPPLHLPL